MPENAFSTYILRGGGVSYDAVLIANSYESVFVADDGEVLSGLAVEMLLKWTALGKVTLELSLPVSL
ncbi:hypothetical protein EYF80_003575 [Liparis tanakae]|uniref:Uncharacterized protein n=1 Tax=Liparis tanakae TaxID=230148 RepID=A0A4Z2J8Y5_9TELE|nr:hypothetical protein EYF80_003575 [Liparis tanakae]